ncbi:hypothetical protein BD413DRAFT_517981 [Trametes elegans]|nr:hypothetical protein BD413DRAFT_517981 [Trametes elegans]
MLAGIHGLQGLSSNPQHACFESARLPLKTRETTHPCRATRKSIDDSIRGSITITCPALAFCTTGSLVCAYHAYSRARSLASSPVSMYRPSSSLPSPNFVRDAYVPQYLQSPSRPFHAIACMCNRLPQCDLNPHMSKILRYSALVVFWESRGVLVSSHPSGNRIPV